jgi:hypothetical protein
MKAVRTLISAMAALLCVAGCCNTATVTSMGPAAHAQHTTVPAREPVSGPQQNYDAYRAKALETLRIVDEATEGIVSEPLFDIPTVCETGRELV